MSRVALSEPIFRPTAPVRFASGLSVYVYERGTAVLATVYDAEAGGAELTQPLTTDSSGRPKKSGKTPFVEPGSYDLRVGNETLAWEAASGEAVDAIEVIREATLNVKESRFEAKGDKTADDSAAIQAALDLAGSRGGPLEIPVGSYNAANLEVNDKVQIEGAGWGTELRTKPGSKAPLLKSKRLGEGGESGGAENVALRNMVIDGNLAENSESTATTVDLDGPRPVVENVEFRNGYINFHTRMSRNNRSSTRPEDGCFRNIWSFDAKHQGWVFDGPHDSHGTDIWVKSDEGKNLTVNTISVWNGLHSYGNPERGIEAWNGEYYGCTAEGAREGDVYIGNNVRWRGGFVFDGGGDDGKIGFVIGDPEHNAFSFRITDVEIEGCINGCFKFQTKDSNGSAHSFISAYCNIASGSVIVGTPNTSCDLTNIWTNDGVENNAVKRTIASASAVAAPMTRVAEYTGTNEITTLQFGKAGQEMQIVLPSTAKLGTSGNIANGLTGPSTARYMFDGSLWRRA